MKPEILTRTERILIEEECDFIADEFPRMRLQALDILYDLVQDPNPLREVYEQRIQRMYEQQIL